MAFERLRREVADLRLRAEEEVRTRRLVVVDDAGIARARINAKSGGPCRLVLLDEDGFERLVLSGLAGVGTVEVAARSTSGTPTRAELVAHDPADGDGCMVGLYLFDQGDAVAAISAFEGGRTDVWTSS